MCADLGRAGLTLPDQLRMLRARLLGVTAPCLAEDDADAEGSRVG